MDLEALRVVEDGWDDNALAPSTRAINAALRFIPITIERVMKEKGIMLPFRYFDALKEEGSQEFFPEYDGGVGVCWKSSEYDVYLCVPGPGSSEKPGFYAKFSDSSPPLNVTF